MTNKELKEKILSNNLGKISFIFKYSDNPFIAKSYVEYIAKNNNLNLNYVETLDDSVSLFDDNNSLSVLITDTFNYAGALPENTIVICKELSENTQLEYVEICKATKDNIVDFASVLVPGLDQQQITWLCDICKYDLYRIYNECQKINIFDIKDQEKIFNLLNDDNGYSDLNSLTIFNYINSMIRKDKNKIADILSDLKTIDVEGTGAVTLLLRQFINIIDIQTNPNIKPEALGLSVKQFMAIKNNIGYYKNKELIDIYDFLTSIDYRLKSGLLQFSNDNRDNNNKLVDYVTCSVLKN